jgi:hypothetical protein
MTYQSSDQSIFSGQPIELYRFAQGTTAWCYTSARDAVTFASEKYSPAPVRRSEIEQTQEFGRAMLTLEAALDIAVVQSFVVSPPDGVLSLTIFRRHLSDADGEFITWWKGRPTTRSTVAIRFTTAAARSMQRITRPSASCRHSQGWK